MLRKALVVIGSLMLVGWGTAHLFPTHDVAAGFGAISGDNKNIILMEWITEGMTLIFIGVLVLLATLFAGEKNKTLKVVYATSAVMLFAMALLSLFTGFNIDFIPYKLCPFIFSLSGVLILQGAFGK